MSRLADARLLAVYELKDSMVNNSKLRVKVNDADQAMYYSLNLGSNGMSESLTNIGGGADFPVFLVDGSVTATLAEVDKVIDISYRKTISKTLAPQPEFKSLELAMNIERFLDEQGEEVNVELLFEALEIYNR